MRRKLLKNLDWGVLICIAVLLGVGMFALFSTSQNTNHNEFFKQLQWVAISIPFFVAFILIDYDKILKIAPVLYGACIFLLILVLFTHEINGARSWFKLGPLSLQPSEFAKIMMIISFARLVDYFKSKDKLNKISSLTLILLFIAVPLALIIKQPDYGTAMVLLVMGIMMIFVAGIKWRYVISATIFACISVPLAYHFVLPQHAKDRIMVFLNPQIDPRGKGYNVIQSKLAVGSGKLWGMGLFNGNQTQLGILPMKTTDFIYSVISEEMGFIISVSVILLFILLIIKIINIARNAKDLYGTLICVGVAAMFLAHFTENVGMTMGLLPITGIPLPFISYGGSAMLTNLIALGLALNVGTRKQKLSFLE